MDRERATIKKKSMIGPDCVIVTWHQVFIERTNFGPGVLTTSMGSVDRKMKGSPFDDGF